MGTPKIIDQNKLSPSYKFSTDRGQAFGPRRKKTCLQDFANNTGADQPFSKVPYVNFLQVKFQFSC